MERFATLNPFIFSALYIALGVAMSLAGVTGEVGLRVAATLAFMLLVLGWLIGLTTLSARAFGGVGVRSRLAMGLAGGALLALILKTIFSAPGASNTVWDVLFLSLFFALLWRTALAVEQAAARSEHVSAGRVLGTTLLLAFSLIGVWILRPKILQIARQVA